MIKTLTANYAEAVRVAVRMAVRVVVRVAVSQVALPVPFGRLVVRVPMPVVEGETSAVCDAAAIPFLV
jgi:hypothetical protein